MSVATLLGEKREDILRIAAKYGARQVRVFGSVARGDADAQSDVDFLVELEAGRSLLDLGGLQVRVGVPAGAPGGRGHRARAEGADA